jgi:hypothetical protein
VLLRRRQVLTLALQVRYAFSPLCSMGRLYRMRAVAPGSVLQHRGGSAPGFNWRKRGGLGWRDVILPPPMHLGTRHRRGVSAPARMGPGYAVPPDDSSHSLDPTAVYRVRRDAMVEEKAVESRIPCHRPCESSGHATGTHVASATATAVWPRRNTWTPGL